MNAYVEPLVSLDLDLVVAIEQLEQVERLLRSHFEVKRFPHSLIVTMPGSDLRIQIQTDEQYNSFVEHAEVKNVLQGKIWAALDPERRGSKRQKDLADIARILESYPDLRPRVPREIISRLFDQNS